MTRRLHVHTGLVDRSDLEAIDGTVAVEFTAPGLSALCKESERMNLQTQR
jgi:hypothetical protein